MLLYLLPDRREGGCVYYYYSASPTVGRTKLRLYWDYTAFYISVFATRAVARGAAIITVDLEGGNGDEVDGIVGNNVALPSFFKFQIFILGLDLAGYFLTPSRVGSILKFWLILQ